VSTGSIAGLISGSSIAYNVSKYGVVALSEGLRLELAPRGIGVSVLCPGFIRTQIVDSGRNLPQRFAGKVGGPRPTTGPIAERIRHIRDRIAQSIVRPAGISWTDYAGKGNAWNRAFPLKWNRDAVPFEWKPRQGIDPLYVGELVREAIENDWPYIFTDTEHEPFVEARFAAIRQGFDRIRGRTPRR
jgi:hypothetical protein